MKTWTIYPNGIGGWFAWNAQKQKRLNLINFGTYSQALSILERKLR